MFVGVRVCDVLQLLEQERVLEDALDRFDEVRLQCGRVLLTRVPRTQELVQRVVVACDDDTKTRMTSQVERQVV